MSQSIQRLNVNANSVASAKLHSFSVFFISVFPSLFLTLFVYYVYVCVCVCSVSISFLWSIVFVFFDSLVAFVLSFTWNTHTQTSTFKCLRAQTYHTVNAMHTNVNRPFDRESLVGPIFHFIFAFFLCSCCCLSDMLLNWLFLMFLNEKRRQQQKNVCILTCPTKA